MFQDILFFLPADRVQRRFRMNQFMKSQVANALMSLKTLDKSIELAAVQDDGVMSREEQKQVKRIRKAVRRFEKEMSRLG